MNIWIVFHQSGWHVYDYNGEFLGFHSFVCDCKGHGMRLKKPWKFISDRSTQQELNQFKQLTNIEYIYDNTEPESGNY